MADFLGMDPEAIRTLAAHMDDAATSINDLANQIGGEVESSPWKGPDADNFRSEWQGTNMAAIRQATDSLTEAANRARANADEQEQISQQ